MERNDNEHKLLTAGEAKIALLRATRDLKEAEARVKAAVAAVAKAEKVMFGAVENDKARDSVRLWLLKRESETNIASVMWFRAFKFLESCRKSFSHDASIAFGKRLLTDV